MNDANPLDYGRGTVSAPVRLEGPGEHQEMPGQIVIAECRLVVLPDNSIAASTIHHEAFDELDFGEWLIRVGQDLVRNAKTTPPPPPLSRG